MALVNFGTALSWISPFSKIIKPTSSPHLLVILFSIVALIILSILFSDLPNYQIKLKIDEPIENKANIIKSDENSQSSSNNSESPSNKIRIVESEMLLIFESDSDRIPKSLPDNFHYWYFLAFPLVIVLILLTNLSLEQQHKNSTDLKIGKKLEGQMKLAYSLCISSGILCLVFGGANLVEDDSLLLFCFLFFACIGQIVVFLNYTAMYIKKDKFCTELEHVHIALTTASLFVGATVCMTLINPPRSIDWTNIVPDIFIRDEVNPNPFAVTAVFFYILWIRYLMFWIKRLKKYPETSENS